jgi:hypothetical protein
MDVLAVNSLTLAAEPAVGVNADTILSNVFVIPVYFT